MAVFAGDASKLKFRPTKPGEIVFFWTDSWCIDCPCGYNLILGDGYPRICECGRVYRMPTYAEVAEPEAEGQGCQGEGQGV